MKQARQWIVVLLTAVFCSVMLGCGPGGKIIGTIGGQTYTLTLTPSATEVTGGQPVTVTATISPALQYSASVMISAVTINNNLSVTVVPSSATLPVNTTTFTFIIDTPAVPAQTQVMATATVMVSTFTYMGSGSVTVDPQCSSTLQSPLALSQTSIPGGATLPVVTGTVTLAQPSTTQCVVQVTGSPSGDVTITPSSVPISAGGTGSGSFTVIPAPLTVKTAVTITATSVNSTGNSTATNTLTITPGQAAGLSAPSLNFTNPQLVGTQSTPQQVTLTNTGTAPLTISSITASGDFAYAPGSPPCPISPSTLAAGANCQISVTFTPTTTGMRSGTLTVTDNATPSTLAIPLTGTGFVPPPTLTSLSPSSANAGAASQTLTLNGTNFLTTSTVTYNTVAHAATYVSATQLTITLSAGDQATAGSYAVVVTNPAPGGGASNTLNFTIGNPVPTLTSLSPSSANVGAASQTLTLNGTNFLPTSTVTYNGVGHAATYVSATQLTITLSAGDQATAGTDPVVVTNPMPGGGASNTVSFTVNNLVPTLTSLSPRDC